MMPSVQFIFKIISFFNFTFKYKSNVLTIVTHTFSFIGGPLKLIQWFTDSLVLLLVFNLVSPTVRSAVGVRRKGRRPSTGRGRYCTWCLSGALSIKTFWERRRMSSSSWRWEHHIRDAQSCDQNTTLVWTASIILLSVLFDPWRFNVNKLLLSLLSCFFSRLSLSAHASFWKQFQAWLKVQNEWHSLYVSCGCCPDEITDSAWDEHTQNRISSLPAFLPRPLTPSLAWCFHDNRSVTAATGLFHGHGTHHHMERFPGDGCLVTGGIKEGWWIRHAPKPHLAL